MPMTKWKCRDPLCSFIVWRIDCRRDASAKAVEFIHGTCPSSYIIRMEGDEYRSRSFKLYPDDPRPPRRIKSKITKTVQERGRAPWLPQRKDRAPRTRVTDTSRREDGSIS